MKYIQNYIRSTMVEHLNLEDIDKIGKQIMRQLLQQDVFKPDGKDKSILVIAGNSNEIQEVGKKLEISIY